MVCVFFDHGVRDRSGSLSAESESESGVRICCKKIMMDLSFRNSWVSRCPMRVLSPV